MHSALTRVQNVFGYFTSVAFFIAAITALSVYLHPSSPDVSISVGNVQVIKGRPHYYSSKKEEYANIRFDLDADLSSLFNWNTKQLFVYVMAVYPSGTPTNSDDPTPVAEAIIWDTIIPAPSSPYTSSALYTRYEEYLPSFITGKQKSSATKKKSNPKRKTTSKTKDAKVSTDSSKDLVQPGAIHLRNQKPKYQITSYTGTLANTANATLVVGWNVQPWVGALLFGSGSGRSPSLNAESTIWGIPGEEKEGTRGAKSEKFDFPPLKGSRAEAAKDEAQKPIVVGGEPEVKPVVDI